MQILYTKTPLSGLALGTGLHTQPVLKIKVLEFTTRHMGALPTRTMVGSPAMNFRLKWLQKVRIRELLLVLCLGGVTILTPPEAAATAPTQ